MNQKHRGKPLLFHDKCSVFFYVHYFNNLRPTAYLKDEAILVKCLAQGHKHRDQPCRDLNPHSDQNLSPMHYTARPQHSLSYMYVTQSGLRKTETYMIYMYDSDFTYVNQDDDSGLNTEILDLDF